MKRLFIGCSLLFSTVAANAFPVIGYVQISTGVVQPGGFNTQTGTVGTFTDTGLTSGQCVQTGPNGLLTTTGAQCGSGGSGGSSSLEVIAGIARSSPTVTLKFPSPHFVGVLTGSSMTVTLNGSIVTLLGNTNVAQLDANAPQVFVGTDTFSITNTSSGTVGTLTIGTSLLATTAGVDYLSYNKAAGNLRLANGAANLSQAIPLSLWNNNSFTGNYTGISFAVGASSTPLAYWYFDNVNNRFAMADGSGNVACYFETTSKNLICNNGIVSSTATFGNATSTSFGNNSYAIFNASGTSQAATFNINGQPSGGVQNKKGGVTINALGPGGPAIDMLVLHSSYTSLQEGSAILGIWNDNPLRNDPDIWIHDVANNSGPDIRIDRPSPNVEMINTSTDNAHGYGKWEPFASAFHSIDMQCGSNRAYDNGTFENLCYMHPLDATDINPGIYLQSQNLTNDSGVLSSSGTSAINFFTLNAHTVGWTAPPNTTASWINAPPDIPGTLGSVMYHGGTVANGLFTTRQWKWTVGGSTQNVLMYGGNSAGNAAYWYDLLGGTQAWTGNNTIAYGHTLSFQDSTGAQGAFLYNPVGLGAKALTISATNGLGIGINNPDTTGNIMLHVAGGVKVVGSTSTAYEGVFSTATTNFHVAISTSGHFITNGTTIAVSSCGTNPTVLGDDNQGTISVGSGVTTACTLTFQNSWGIAPTCTLSDDSTTVAGDISSISATSVVFGFSATLGSGHIYYRCGCSGVNCK